MVCLLSARASVGHGDIYYSLSTGKHMRSFYCHVLQPRQACFHTSYNIKAASVKHPSGFCMRVFVFAFFQQRRFTDKAGLHVKHM